MTTTLPQPEPSRAKSTPIGAPQRDSGARLADISATQWKSGLAAWLGWLFDGLDMHLYTLVAAPFVAELLAVPRNDASVGKYSSIIQAAFLIGWAFGGAFFGRIGDRLGRSRTLVLTIFTYAVFTGLSFFAQAWWHLLIFRFLAALGIGGEWAVGAALLSETWPSRWRPWLAAVLQTAVNVGIMLAGFATFVLAEQPSRVVFLVGLAPALVTLWIRRAVPETEEWHAAKLAQAHAEPSIGELFRGSVLRTTLLTSAVCALTLSGHWAFTYWFVQHMRTLPDVADWTDAERNKLVSSAMSLLMISAIGGNFISAVLAKWMGYRKALSLMCVTYFISMAVAYGVPRSHEVLWYCLPPMGASSGLFGLFTMYLPPLFPTLLRTTGAGFCYNIGRIAAAAGTAFFGLVTAVGDYRQALFYTGFLFLPAAILALVLPEPPEERGSVTAID